ncbi:MAG TPA: PEGA domain-containing protein [Myxococcota bacterium]|nr:PEGA domain-containing protein [Myxococcota bacterium]
MRSNSIFRFVMALTLLAWSGTAIAQTRGRAPKGKRVWVAILPVQVKGVSPKLGNRLGTTVFKELREIGVFRFISPKQTARKILWMKKKKIFKPDCTDSPKCVRKVGRTLKAKVIYHLMAAKAQKGVTLNMRTFDVKSGQQIRKDSQFSTEEPADLERAARWLTRTVSGPMVSKLAPGKGKLNVSCEEQGADLYLNGKSFGKRTGKSFKVGSGVFDIMVKKEGYTTFHDVVVIKPGQKKTIAAVIKSQGPEVPEVPEVVAAAIGSGTHEKTGGSSSNSGQATKKTQDLPAWAVFEKPKPKPIVLNSEQGKTTVSGGEKMPWQNTAKKEPYLPGEREEKVAKAGKRRESKFYETWWFWTLIGAGVAGAAGTTAYFLLAGEGGGGAGTGSAIINWE